MSLEVAAHSLYLRSLPPGVSTHQTVAITATSHWRLHSVRYGHRSDRQIVMVHGGGTWLFSFRHLLEIFGEAGLESHAIDMPGHGYTQKLSDSLEQKFDMEFMVGALKAYIDSHDLEEVDLIGSSWGAGGVWRLPSGIPRMFVHWCCLPVAGVWAVRYFCMNP